MKRLSSDNNALTLSENSARVFASRTSTREDSDPDEDAALLFGSSAAYEFLDLSMNKKTEAPRGADWRNTL
jgi:hypothetical protein